MSISNLAALAAALATLTGPAPVRAQPSGAYPPPHPSDKARVADAPRPADQRVEISMVAEARAIDDGHPMLIVEVRYAERCILTRERAIELIGKFQPPPPTGHAAPKPPEPCRILIPNLGDRTPRFLTPSFRFRPDPATGYAPRWVAQTDDPEAHRRLFPDAAPDLDEWHSVASVTAVFDGPREILEQPLRLDACSYMGAPELQIDKLHARHRDAIIELWSRPEPARVHSAAAPSPVILSPQSSEAATTPATELTVVLRGAAGLPAGISYMEVRGVRSRPLNHRDIQLADDLLTLKAAFDDAPPRADACELVWTSYGLRVPIQRRPASR